MNKSLLPIVALGFSSTVFLAACSSDQSMENEAMSTYGEVSERELAEVPDMETTSPATSTMGNAAAPMNDPASSADLSELAETSEAFIDDAILAGKVKTRLIAEADLAAFEIDVEVEEGAVSLRGEVPDEASKTLAAEVTRATEGVNEVSNSLTVAPTE